MSGKKVMKKKKLFGMLSVGGVIVGLSLAAGVVHAKEQKKPNILFLFSDDHALKTLSVYPDAVNKTPNFQRLANEGAVFDNSFVVNSICCPSRAAIMTGKHSHANGVTGNGADWDGTQWVYPRELAKVGYQTALIGKWHLKQMPKNEFQYWEVLVGKGGQGDYYNPDFESRSGQTQVKG